MREDIRDIIRELCKGKGAATIEGEAMPDRIHLLLSIQPKYSVSQIMGYLKEHSGLMIVGRHADLKDEYGNRHFRAAGHCVSTAGIQEKALRKYIQEQEKQDRIEDEVSTREYEDPFKGQAR